MATKKKAKRATSKKKTAKRKASLPTRPGTVVWRGGKTGVHMASLGRHGVGVRRDGKGYRIIFVERSAPRVDAWRRVGSEGFTGSLRQAKAYAAGMLRVRAAGLA